MTPLFPPSHTIPPTAPHTHTIIFLHGRGSNALEFASEILESQDSQDRFFPSIFPGIKWVFPCAPFRHATIEGESMHQWFDMSSVQDPQSGVEVQKPGLWQSVEQLSGIVEEKAREVGMRRVVLAGISQGCAAAVFALLVKGMRVGGFIGISGWVALAEELQKVVVEPEWLMDVCEVPVLLQHCCDDEVVPVRGGEEMRDRLEQLGLDVKWQCFEEGGHWLNEPKGVDGIVEFVKGVMELRWM
jgi:predicted esterase